MAKRKYKTSAALRKWRSRQKRGAIMKPSTFKKIEASARRRGAKNPKAIAGAAYWKTARAKFRNRRKKG